MRRRAKPRRHLADANVANPIHESSWWPYFLPMVHFNASSVVVWGVIGALLTFLTMQRFPQLLPTYFLSVDALRRLQTNQCSSKADQDALFRDKTPKAIGSMPRSPIASFPWIAYESTFDVHFILHLIAWTCAIVLSLLCILLLRRNRAMQNVQGTAAQNIVVDARQTRSTHVTPRRTESTKDTASPPSTPAALGSRASLRQPASWTPSHRNSSAARRHIAWHDNDVIKDLTGGLVHSDAIAKHPPSPVTLAVAAGEIQEFASPRGSLPSMHAADAPTPTLPTLMACMGDFEVKEEDGKTELPP
jgi:hypothetical protein